MRFSIIMGMALTGAVAVNAPAMAQSASTTIIEQHKVVPAPAPTPTTVTHHTTTTTVTTKTSSTAEPAAPPARRHVVAHKARKPAKVVAKRTVVVDRQPAPPPAEPQPAAMVDRKTVIHRDENGDVTRRTRIDKQDADGNHTTVIHRSTDAAPPSPN